MQAITYEYARNNFDRVFNMISAQNDGLIIVKEDKNYVLMDKDMLDSVMETIDISKDKDFVLSLKKPNNSVFY